MSRVRIQVDDEHGPAALILDTSAILGALPEGKRARLAELSGRLVADVAELPGVSGEEHARHILLCLLTRQHADELAYERVAEQRGLLPL